MDVVLGIAMAAALSLAVSSTAVAAPTSPEPEIVVPTLPLPEPVVRQPAGDEGLPPHEPAAESVASDVDTGGDPSADEMFKERVRDAAQHYSQGRSLASEGRYVEAAAEFERSHDAFEFGDTLYRIVEAYDAASEPLPALRKAREYLALESCEGGRESPGNYPCGEPGQRDDVRQRAERLRRLVAELKLQLADGVVLRKVKVADRVVPLADFPVLAAPGSFVVALTGPNKGQLRSYDVTVEAGDTFNLFVPPFVTPVIDDGGPDIESGPIVSPHDQARRQRNLRRAFWGGVGLTGASGVVLGVLAGLSRFNQNAHDDGKCSVECTAEMYDNLPEDPALTEGMRYPQSFRNKSTRFASGTNAMVGVTAGLGLVTIVLGVFSFTNKRSGVNARVQVRAGGLSLRW